MLIYVTSLSIAYIEGYRFFRTLIIIWFYNIGLKCPKRYHKTEKEVSVYTPSRQHRDKRSSESYCQAYKCLSAMHMKIKKKHEDFTVS